MTSPESIAESEQGQEVASNPVPCGSVRTHRPDNRDSTVDADGSQYYVPFTEHKTHTQTSRAYVSEKGRFGPLPNRAPAEEFPMLFGAEADDEGSYFGADGTIVPTCTTRPRTASLTDTTPPIAVHRPAPGERPYLGRWPRIADVLASCREARAWNESLPRFDPGPERTPRPKKAKGGAA
jgi:hypothetical protein